MDDNTLPEPPPVKISPLFDNKKTQSYDFSITFIDVASERNIKRYLTELLANAIKTAVREKYYEIQSVVDEVILSEEIRDLMKQIISDEIKKITEQSIKDMFGKEK